MLILVPLINFAFTDSPTEAADIQTATQKVDITSNHDRQRVNSWHEVRRANPAADKAWRSKLTNAKRQTVDPGRNCTVCDATFCTVNARSIRQVSPRLTCGTPECRLEVRRRAQRQATASRLANKQQATGVLHLLTTRALNT